jgi:uncharacterized protein YgbK (DUF1537 family)
MEPCAITIVADDLTGALDSAAQFAGRGPVVVVCLRAQCANSAAVVAFDCDTRDRPMHEVLPALEEIVPLVRGIPYKKVDSTMRGAAGFECAVLRKLLGLRGVLLAPSFPGAGRTLREGILYVRGTPMPARGAGWHSPAEPASGETSEPAPGYWQLLDLALVRAGPGPLYRRLSKAIGTILADAETDVDLRYLAWAGVRAGGWLLAGSAGLAGSLAEVLFGDRVEKPPSPPRPTLFVFGSANAVSRQQVESLSAAGLAPVFSGGQSPEQLVAQMRTQLVARGLAVGVMPPGKLNAQEAAALQQALAQAAAALAAQEGIRCVFLTGGQTARLVMEHLGVQTLWPRGEVEPGVVFSQARLPWGREIWFITKAGGFGGSELALQLTGLKAQALEAHEA